MIFLEDKVVSRITPLRPSNQYKARKNGLTKPKDCAPKRIKHAIVIGLNTPVEIDVL
jgi:hypothetical protein